MIRIFRALDLIRFRWSSFTCWDFQLKFDISPSQGCRISSQVADKFICPAKQFKVSSHARLQRNERIFRSFDNSWLIKCQSYRITHLNVDLNFESNFCLTRGSFNVYKLICREYFDCYLQLIVCAQL